MSGGVHRWWKAAMIDWLGPRPGLRYLDVAGGTGDVASRIARRIGPAARAVPVVVCDVNEAMLAQGVARAQADDAIGGSLLWVSGNAECLPLSDACMDGYTIAFGIRNVADIAAALAEARRILKPGGRFLCLEFSTVEIPGLDRLYDAYSRHVLPHLGEWITGDRAAYEYLVESIRRFPAPTRFKSLIADAGLEPVTVRNLSGGIAALHSAWRL
jgi:demethylmenaquinone methyltransferase/2-methoxy-6-polyprenyl-1,4-benzoquinol methylase